MKHFILTVLLFGSFLPLIAQKAPAAADPGRKIDIKITPLKNTKVYLGSYYGTTLALFDSAFLNDKSEGTFLAPVKLTGGIYFLVTKEPEYAILQPFDLLMDDVQHFKIVGDTSEKEKFVITGSEENKRYDTYKKYTTEQAKYKQA